MLRITRLYPFMLAITKNPMLARPFLARTFEVATHGLVLVVVNVLVAVQAGLLIYWFVANSALPWFVIMVPVCLALIMVLSRPGLLRWEDYFAEAPDAPMRTTADEWLLVIAQITLGVLKSSQVLDWSWLVVLIPAWIVVGPIACVALHLLLRFIIGCYKAVFSLLACS